MKNCRITVVWEGDAQRQSVKKPLHTVQCKIIEKCVIKQVAAYLNMLQQKRYELYIN